MVELQVPIKSINIGGMQFKNGRKQITKAVSVNQIEAETFRKLEVAGVELDLRVVATDPKRNFEVKLKEAGF